MAKRYELISSIAQNNNVNPDDVWIVKHALRSGGFYNAPADEMHPYPDQRLFDGIQRFQRADGLKADGIMNPDGETETAIQRLLPGVATYRCTNCGAWHGGVYSPRVCYDCWNNGHR